MFWFGPVGSFEWLFEKLSHFVYAKTLTRRELGHLPGPNKFSRVVLVIVKIMIPWSDSKLKNCTGVSKLLQKLITLYKLDFKSSSLGYTGELFWIKDFFNEKKIKMKKTGKSFQSGPNLMSFAFIRGVGYKITHFSSLFQVYSRDPSVKSWRKPWRTYYGSCCGETRAIPSKM